MRQPTIVIRANNLYRAITGKPGKLDVEAFTAAQRRAGVPQEVAERFIARFAPRLKSLPKSKRGHAPCVVIASKSGKRRAKRSSKSGRKARK